MSRWLTEALPEIASRIAAAPYLMVFADFDGTLAPFVDLPEKASLPPGMYETLLNLAVQTECVLAVISGREVRDLEARVGIKDVVYAGNHGLEIRGRGLWFLETQAASRRGALRALIASLAMRIRSIGGALVEDKGLTASVHYRLVAPARRTELEHVVRAVVAAEGARQFRVSPGHLVYEVRPTVPWDKGMAVRWIRDQLDRNHALTVYLGDDATDEDAFATIPDGITIHVGASSKTSARYFVNGVMDVQLFLGWLARRFYEPRPAVPVRR